MTRFFTAWGMYLLVPGHSPLQVAPLRCLLSSNGTQNYSFVPRTPTKKGTNINRTEKQNKHGEKRKNITHEDEGGDGRARQAAER